MKREIGDGQGALAVYEEARDLAEGLRRTAVASDADAVMDKLALAYVLIGQVQDDRRMYPEAIASWEKARAIRQALLDADPSRYMDRLGLVTIYGNIGHTLEAMGRPTDGLASWEKARAIEQAMVDTGEYTGFRDRLAWCHQNIGDLLARAGRMSEALASVERARAIQQQLVDAYPNVTEFQRDLARTHQSLGGLFERLDRRAEALDSYQKAVAMMRALMEASPSSGDFQNEMAISLVMTGRVHERAGRASEAAKTYRELVTFLERLPAPGEETHYNLSCAHAMLAGVAGQPGSGLSAADKQAEGDIAMSGLRKLATSGFVDLTTLQSDADLDALRARPDFRLLLMDLALPADPFAPGH